MTIVFLVPIIMLNVLKISIRLYIILIKFYLIYKLKIFLEKYINLTTITYFVVTRGEPFRGTR